QDLVEVGAVDLGEVVVGAELRLDLVQGLAGDLPGVQGLDGQAAGLAASGGLAFRRLGCRVAAVLIAHLASNCASRLTISRAESAASAPLLPALVPERSMACSMESTVRTSKATGMPNCRDTWARP